MKKLKQSFFLLATMTLMVFSLVGCGSSKKNSATTQASSSAAGGNPVEDAVDDVADGAEDIVTDASKGFDNYSDAHDYFMKKMGEENDSAKYEIRNETKDLQGYAEGKNGYSFELYDTSKNKEGDRVGKFYIDNKDGSVYRTNDADGSVTPYTWGSDTGAATGTDGAAGTDNGGDGTGSTTGNSTGSNGVGSNGGNTSGNSSGN